MVSALGPIVKKLTFTAFGTEFPLTWPLCLW